MFKLTVEGYMRFQRAVHDGPAHATDDFFERHFTHNYVNHVNGVTRDLQHQKAAVLADRKAGRIAYPYEVPWLIQDGLDVSARSFGSFEGDWTSRGFGPGGTALVSHLMRFTPDGKRQAYMHLVRPLKEGDPRMKELDSELTDVFTPKRFDTESFRAFLERMCRCRSEEVEGLCEELLAPELRWWVNNQILDFDGAKATLRRLRQGPVTNVDEVNFLIQQEELNHGSVYFSNERPGEGDLRLEAIEDCLFDVKTGKLKEWVSALREMEAGERMWSPDK